MRIIAGVTIENKNIFIAGFDAVLQVRMNLVTIALALARGSGETDTAAIIPKPRPENIFNEGFEIILKIGFVEVSPEIRTALKVLAIVRSVAEPPGHAGLKDNVWEGGAFDIFNKP